MNIFKPFNFILVGQQRNKIILMLPYAIPDHKEFTSIPYRTFIDYRIENVILGDTESY